MNTISKDLENLINEKLPSGYKFTAYSTEECEKSQFNARIENETHENELVLNPQLLEGGVFDFIIDSLVYLLKENHE